MISPLCGWLEFSFEEGKCTEYKPLKVDLDKSAKIFLAYLSFKRGPRLPVIKSIKFFLTSCEYLFSFFIIASRTPFSLLSTGPRNHTKSEPVDSASLLASADLSK